MNLNLDHSSLERVRFGDVVRNVNETVKDAAAAGIDRVIALEHLDASELKISRWGNIADGTTFTKRVRPGQTLFGKRRAYQRKAAYAEFEAITSGDILVFEANPARLLPGLLPFLVQSEPFFSHALDTSAGSLSPRTSWGDLAKFEFDLPPLDEQQRIADLLWAIDAHIAAVAGVEAQVLKTNAAHIDALLTSTGEFAQLGEVTLEIVDCEHKTAPTGESAFARVIGTPDVRDGALLIDTARPIGEETYLAWTKRRVPAPGDLIFTREAPAGEVAVVPEMPRVALGQRTVLIRPRDEGDSLAIWGVLRSPSVQATIKRKAAGSTVPHLNVADIRSLEIPWPSSQEARAEVVGAVRRAEQQVESVSRELRDAKQLRRGVSAAVLKGAS